MEKNLDEIYNLKDELNSLLQSMNKNNSSLDGEDKYYFSFSKQMSNEDINTICNSKCNNIIVKFKYDDYEKVLDEYNQYQNHSLLQVRLKDEKYGIDGIYLADPTNDSDMKNDYYTFALMTHNENIFCISSNDNAFYCVNSLEKFYNKCNLWVNSQNNNSSVYYSLIKKILKTISDIDKKKYNELMGKYSNIINMDCTKQDIQNILNDIGNYILENCNNSINKESFNSTIKFLYENFYGFQSEEKMYDGLDKTIKLNEERKKEYFKEYDIRTL